MAFRRPEREMPFFFFFRCVICFFEGFGEVGYFEGVGGGGGAAGGGFGC